MADKTFHFIMESKSSFINTLFSSFDSNFPGMKRKKRSSLCLPIGLEPYWENIIDLHNSPEQLLTNPSEWIDNLMFEENTPMRSYSTSREGGGAMPSFFIQIYHPYDENDRDLCISFIDREKHRRTLAVCIEMYLRRQLKVYSDFFDGEGYGIRANKRYRNLQLTLPQLCVASNNPNAIQKLDVVIDKKL